jgi:hypothetical protein
VTRSIGAVGSSADNALAESFNATIKRETLAGAPGWESPVTARRAMFARITNYNTRRRHSTSARPAPSATRRATPQRCKEPRRHKSRVHDQGTRPTRLNVIERDYLMASRD